MFDDMSNRSKRVRGSGAHRIGPQSESRSVHHRFRYLPPSTMALKWKLLPSPSSAKDEKYQGDAIRRAGLTVRIARVFSKSSNNGSKQEIVQTAPFLSLPYELLEQILDAVCLDVPARELGD